MKVICAHETLSEPFRDVYPSLEIWKDQKEADLVIFTGGEDISPFIYKEEPNGAYGVNRERDKKELDLLSRILNGKFSVKKVLGVCRGHQLISAYCGLRIIQDIHSMGIPHFSRHRIFWSAENIFSSWTTVNSMHHQAVSDNPHSLFHKALPRYLAKDENGISECILWGQYILGVQFHPEFMEQGEKERFFNTLNEWVEGRDFFPAGNKERSKKPDESVKVMGYYTAGNRIADDGIGELRISLDNTIRAVSDFGTASASIWTNDTRPESFEIEEEIF